jgi:hypothetical protein
MEVASREHGGRHRGAHRQDTETPLATPSRVERASVSTAAIVRAFFMKRPPCPQDRPSAPWRP